MKSKTYNEYYQSIRLAGGTPMSEQDWNARNTSVPQTQPIMIRCDCGHTISKNLVMSASLGTSCPDCYDRMDD